MLAAADPSLVRVGINLASPEDEASAARVAITLNELMGRFLNLLRLTAVAAPIVLQGLFIHSTDLGSWLLRLGCIYSLVGGVSMLVAPEQAYNGMALRELRWFFERIYPEAPKWNGSPSAALDLSPPLLKGLSQLGELSGKLVRLRWHGTHRYLGLTEDGWAATGDEQFATVLVLQHIVVKGERVPDTYTMRVSDTGARWDRAWLSFRPVNQLRLGGWLGAFTDQADASPYKMVTDSSCPLGTCKILAAWTAPPQALGHLGRQGVGFYLAEQRCGGQLFVGFGPDQDAAILELVTA